MKKMSLAWEPGSSDKRLERCAICSCCCLEHDVLFDSVGGGQLLFLFLLVPEKSVEGARSGQQGKSSDKRLEQGAKGSGFPLAVVDSCWSLSWCILNK